MKSVFVSVLILSLSACGPASQNTVESVAVGSGLFEINLHADGELQAAHKLTEAAELIGRNPSAIQLRYLQTIREIGSSDKTTTIIPVPLDLIKGILTQ